MGERALATVRVGPCKDLGELRPLRTHLSPLKRGHKGNITRASRREETVRAGSRGEERGS